MHAFSFDSCVTITIPSRIIVVTFTQCVHENTERRLCFHSICIIEPWRDLVDVYEKGDVKHFCVFHFKFF